MAFNQTEKNEIEKIVKKEVKEFLESNTLKQFETKLINIISSEVKKGGINKDIKLIVTKSLQDFYEYLFTTRNIWGDRLKR
ncbi:hypothetical protein UFOVP117_91 [uncultured Caudovirales phage]|jgi:hypothetical protein|uniref:Uncharacterized protein n=1 Tax=uncultured Caudovirales phage TaxID=2100421 RepID=A0A6J5L4R6_9CAUD|nr:hypothetical protein UFOVP117_91 [uncultured Caudovirales phage]